jgi:hypothetical protein
VQAPVFRLLTKGCSVAVTGLAEPPTIGAAEALATVGKLLDVVHFCCGRDEVVFYAIGAEGIF